LPGIAVNDPSVSHIHGYQPFVAGSGSPEDAASGRKADPNKYVILVDLGAENMELLGLIGKYGDRPATRGIDPEEYLDHSKEQNSKVDEAMKHDESRKYGYGVIYWLDYGDASHPGTGVVHDSLSGRVDTVRWNDKKKDYDTTQESVH